MRASLAVAARVAGALVCACSSGSSPGASNPNRADKDTQRKTIVPLETLFSLHSAAVARFAPKVAKLRPSQPGFGRAYPDLDFGAPTLFAMLDSVRRKLKKRIDTPADPLPLDSASNRPLGGLGKPVAADPIKRSDANKRGEAQNGFAWDTSEDGNGKPNRMCMRHLYRITDRHHTPAPASASSALTGQLNGLPRHLGVVDAYSRGLRTTVWLLYALGGCRDARGQHTEVQRYIDHLLEEAALAAPLGFFIPFRLDREPAASTLLLRSRVVPAYPLQVSVDIGEADKQTYTPFGLFSHDVTHSKFLFYADILWMRQPAAVGGLLDSPHATLQAPRTPTSDSEAARNYLGGEVRDGTQPFIAPKAYAERMQARVQRFDGYLQSLSRCQRESTGHGSLFFRLHEEPGALFVPTTQGYPPRQHGYPPRQASRIEEASWAAYREAFRTPFRGGDGAGRTHVLLELPGAGLSLHDYEGPPITPAADPDCDTNPCTNPANSSHRP